MKVPQSSTGLEEHVFDPNFVGSNAMERNSEEYSALIPQGP
jgi:hypothetical protein